MENIYCVVCKKELTVINVGSGKDMILKSIPVCVNGECMRYGLLTVVSLKLTKKGGAKDEVRTKNTRKQNKKNG